METETEENKKTKKNLLIVLGVILMVLGHIFANAANFKRSLPLGVMLIYSGLLIFCVLHALGLFFPLKRDLRSPIRQASNWFFCILVAGLVVFTGYDFVKGPQEIVLKDARIEIRKERVGKRSVTRTYLTGTKEDGYIFDEIQIKGNKIEKEATNILYGDNEKVIVSYYKVLKKYYDIKAVD